MENKAKQTRRKGAGVGGLCEKKKKIDGEMVRTITCSSNRAAEHDAFNKEPIDSWWAPESEK